MKINNTPITWEHVAVVKVCLDNIKDKIDKKIKEVEQIREIDSYSGVDSPLKYGQLDSLKYAYDIVSKFNIDEVLDKE